MRKITLLLFTLVPVFLLASGLQLSRPLIYAESESPYAILNISWQNAWNNEKNNDGIWLFFKGVKYVDYSGYQHLSVAPDGHAVVSVFSESDPTLGFQASEDGAGLFVYPQGEFRGDVSATIKVSLRAESFAGINTRATDYYAYGIEMVQIPGGAFAVGSSNDAALAFGSLYQPDDDRGSAGTLQVESEDQVITVAPDGDLYYQAKAGYEGDQTGTIPASFPKGVTPFIIMKYEPTEGQYTDFLNTLANDQIASRLISKAEGYYERGGTIAQVDGFYTSPYPDKPASFIGWADAMAYADWAGLRPLTEFEFTKAARGPVQARDNGFPWGTDSKAKMQRLPNKNGQLQMINSWDEADLTDDRRPFFGASYYWVMDLSGSLWERVVSVGHEKGRSFVGSHGDGILSADANATNADWPVSEVEAGGVGFRGGGFYGYGRTYHEYNPFSPIAYRPYGGWHGVMREKAYGARFGRSMSLD